MPTKKILKTLAAFGIVWPLMSWAGPVISGGGTGDLTTYVQCRNKDYTFEIRGTAIPTFKQGLLESVDGDFVGTLKCDATSAPVAPGAPSAGQIIWKCREYPMHDGNILVKIERSGLTGLTTAYVSQMQMHPLPAQALATLICQ